jgi:hypothetical protein
LTPPDRNIFNASFHDQVRQKFFGQLGRRGFMGNALVCRRGLVSAPGATPDMGDLPFTDVFRPFGLRQDGTAVRAYLRLFSGCGHACHPVFLCFIETASPGIVLIRINIPLPQAACPVAR